MPKKVLFSRELIIEKSFELFKEEGIDAITARNVAKILDSSPAPIYSSIGSMEILKEELIKKSKKLFMEYLTKERTGIKFLDIGMGIAIFAREEKKLFSKVFLRDNIDTSLVDGFVSLVQEEANKDERLSSINDEMKQELMISCWIFAHGLSALIATDFFKEPTDAFIEKSLRDNPAKLFYEYVSKYSKKKNK